MSFSLTLNRPASSCSVDPRFCPCSNARCYHRAAYCPLARGRDLENPVLMQVAQEVGRPVSQVMLRWLVQHGVIPLPKSSNPARQAENAASLEFGLSQDQMDRTSFFFFYCQHFLFYPYASAGNPGYSFPHNSPQMESRTDTPLIPFLIWLLHISAAVCIQVSTS